MPPHPWVREFAGSITVCDPQGIILEMNEKSATTFAKEGGRALIGSCLLDCHPEPSKTTMRELLDTQRINVYTIEKRGQKKLVYQTPWFRDGQYGGFMEIVLEIPEQVPHFIREP